MPKSATLIHTSDFPFDDLEHEAWNAAAPLKIKSIWNGQRATKIRRFETRMLWSDKALYVKFDANQGEPLVVHNFPKLDQKTKGLWHRDVCELFIAPDKAERHKYFEFEVAPTGEWFDLQIHKNPDERLINEEYVSGMQTMTSITRDLVVLAVKIEWTAFGVTPAAGDIWLGNLFRCVGKGKTRGFLAWSATRTEDPNFHVPERFGEFLFVD